ncbi:MAG: GntR family transcriptional regulator [Armatimonadota bacterium]
MPLAEGLGKRSEDILITLRQEISAGRYADGSRLESEAQLCARFGVSRSTVRRAITRLVDDGRVAVRQGVGAYVLTQPARQTSRTISAMLRANFELLPPLQHYALERQYLFGIYSGLQSDYHPSTERIFLERVHAERHAGLLAICTPTEPHNTDLLQAMVADGIRVVHLDWFRPSLPEESYLLPDYRRAGYQMVVHGQLAGYAHFRYIGMEVGVWPGARLLQQGVMEALDDYHGGYRHERDFFDFPPAVETLELHREQLRAYLRGLPSNTAVLCRGNEMARAVLAILAEIGRQAPDDIGVISATYGDQAPSICDNGGDMLTFDYPAMFQRAIDAVTGQGEYPLRELIPPILVRRGTFRYR